MKRYTIGDIHGCYRGLLQCLERSNFNKDKDFLISLGDIADGWNQVYECVEELLSIKNLITIKGNHDDWFNSWIQSDLHPCSWQQGGFGTLSSYCEILNKDYLNKYSGGYLTSLIPEDIPISHKEFFNNQKNYYILDNMCFVHGGFNRHHTLQENELFDKEQFYWDRDLWYSALSYQSLKDNHPEDFKYKFKMHEGFNKVFIGHTDVMNWGKPLPMKAANIWNLDTGGGFKGKVTIMNIDTEEYFQSDLVQELYPEQRGRN